MSANFLFVDKAARHTFDVLWYGSLPFWSSPVQFRMTPEHSRSDQAAAVIANLLFSALLQEI